MGFDLRLEEGALESTARRLREVRLGQLDRALEQESGGFASGIADDLAPKRILGVPGNAGSDEGRTVQPGGVDVERIEVHRDRLGPVESVTVRWRAPPVAVPALANDPTLLRGRCCHPA